MKLLLILICIYFIPFKKWYIQCQEDPLTISSTTVETQYLHFNMTHYGVDGGVFSSPNFPHNYPQDTILFYQFTASIDYRVVVEIDSFQIRGVSPQCTHDYLDVFINLTDFNFIHDQLLHRYCGRNKPPLLISYTNLLLLGFFTEDTQTERGFNGSFHFISEQRYKNHLIQEPCNYIFNSSISKRGEFSSSTYPGTYLPWQFCNYSFIGLPGERIHIRFRDLMLFKTLNTQHCAIDLIRLYDNIFHSNELQQKNFTNKNIFSEEINEHHITDLCGTYTMPLDIYSTSNYLLFYFITTHYAELTDDEQARLNDASSPLLWRKGFYAEYEFLSTLTKLDFISKTKSNQYLSGTECDQTIKSFGQGYGQIQSPNWPNLYKPQTSCTTYFLGIDDRYALENVEFEFEQFDIDCQIASFVIYNASRIYDYNFNLRSSSVLTNTMSIIKEKSLAFNNYYQQDVDFKDNLTFCGHFKPEGRFVSQNALLKVSFVPNNRLTNRISPSLLTGGKYQAKYKFIKSYHQIADDKFHGTSSNDCNLVYYQSRRQSGKFEPPRSSQNDYFSNSNCTFHFYISNPNFRLLIWYDYFIIADDDYTHCPSDNLTYSYRSYKSSSYSLYPYIYCGYQNFPPPYLTSSSTEQFRIHFRSNNDSNTSLGFNGRYEFINQSHHLFSSKCRNPFDPIIDIDENEQTYGNISSNGYPENIICEWSYRTTYGFQFNLQITILDMEGSKIQDPPLGCQSSVLKIYSHERMDELCGKQENITYILTNSNWFTIQFISLNRQTKEYLQGFYLTWTIVQLKINNQCLLSSNNYFDCQKSSTINETSFCIHRSLICDGFIHCQPLSNHDEFLSNCSQNSSSNSYFISFPFLRQHYILISIIFLLSFIILFISIIFILLIIKTKQDCIAKQKKNKSTNIDLCDVGGDDDNEDFSDIRLIKQTVTTV
ncbi:unnamed protein product [Adineta steineri]|uniref:CUB domain-containing protein n=1 Tax=Adineta steineri TaxID=433720 RepID=A0A815XR40_9BILA|nr:unnamed protein product [Adineta steineri]CAF1560669.1 unnamed protein product [Adineta steineri]